MAVIFIVGVVFWVDVCFDIGFIVFGGFGLLIVCRLVNKIRLKIKSVVIKVINGCLDVRFIYLFLSLRLELR